MLDFFLFSAAASGSVYSNNDKQSLLVNAVVPVTKPLSTAVWLQSGQDSAFPLVCVHYAALACVGDFVCDHSSSTVSPPLVELVFMFWGLRGDEYPPRHHQSCSPHLHGCTSCHRQRRGICKLAPRLPWRRSCVWMLMVKKAWRPPTWGCLGFLFFPPVESPRCSGNLWPWQLACEPGPTLITSHTVNKQKSYCIISLLCVWADRLQCGGRKRSPRNLSTEACFVLIKQSYRL